MTVAAWFARRHAPFLWHNPADKGDAVLWIEAPSGDVTAEEIEVARAARRRPM